MCYMLQSKLEVPDIFIRSQEGVSTNPPYKVGLDQLDFYLNILKLYIFPKKKYFQVVLAQYIYF